MSTQFTLPEILSVAGRYLQEHRRTHNRGRRSRCHVQRSHVNHVLTPAPQHLQERYTVAAKDLWLTHIRSAEIRLRLPINGSAHRVDGSVIRWRAKDRRLHRKARGTSHAGKLYWNDIGAFWIYKHL